MEAVDGVDAAWGGGGGEVGVLCLEIFGWRLETGRGGDGGEKMRSGVVG